VAIAGCRHKRGGPPRGGEGRLVDFSTNAPILGRLDVVQQLLAVDDIVEHQHLGAGVETVDVELVRDGELAAVGEHQDALFGVDLLDGAMHVVGVGAGCEGGQSEEDCGKDPFAHVGFVSDGPCRWTGFGGHAHRIVSLWRNFDQL